MNKNTEPETEDRASVLFRFYTRKVLLRIKSPEKPDRISEKRKKM
jgi:hypothetical protein